MQFEHKRKSKREQGLFEYGGMVLGKNIRKSVRKVESCS